MKPATATRSDAARPAGSQPTPWRRSDLTRQRAGKALHYGNGLARFVLVVAGDGWAIGSAGGSEVVDLEEWAAREHVELPDARGSGVAPRLVRVGVDRLGPLPPRLVGRRREQPRRRLRTLLCHLR